MMGRQEHGQGRFFYQFDLEEMVPADHLLRGIGHFLDLSGLRKHLAPFYSHTGRPSIDPELMIRMLIVGYAYGIRSERRLCEEVQLNLAYRWFCNLGIEDGVPDHSTFSKNRHGRFREGTLHADDTVIYRASAFDCGGCPLKPRCCPKIPARKIRRSIHEDARDYARMIGRTKAFEQSTKDRKKVEITFAHMKRIIGLKRFRLRGMTGARDELLLAATALNLRKLAKMIWRPPMTGELCPE